MEIENKWKCPGRPNIWEIVAPLWSFDASTFFSNQGIADMELPDNLLAELEILENITSCNKVLSQ